MGMGPVQHRYKHLRRRMRRSLYYGKEGRMDSLSLPASEAAAGYFHRSSPFDYLGLDWACRLSREACVQPSSLVVALVYLERMRHADKTAFEAMDPNDLYVGSLVLASKYLHDDGERDFVYNDEWAASASKPLSELNSLELQALSALGWDLRVSEDHFMERLRQLEQSVARISAGKRPQWSGLTYAEVLALAGGERTAVQRLLQPLLAIVGLASLLYTTAVVTLTSLVLYAAPSTSTSPTAQPSELLPAPSATSAGLLFPDHGLPPSSDAADTDLRLPDLRVLQEEEEEEDEGVAGPAKGRAELAFWLRQLLFGVCQPRNRTGPEGLDDGYGHGPHRGPEPAHYGFPPPMLLSVR